jgi:ferrochelatase
MKKASLAVILCNLGTPEQPTPAAVRKFLAEFLADPRVVELPRPLWWLILHGFILPFRPQRIAIGYRKLWDHYGDSPLRAITVKKVAALQQEANLRWGSEKVVVRHAFCYGSPGIVSVLEECRALAEKVLLLPLYPQYSGSTTAAVYDQVARYQLRQRDVADVVVHKHYYAHPAYRRALAESVRGFWQQQGRGDHLLASFHGVPQSYIDKGDPYFRHCTETVENLVHDLGLASGESTIAFQSRFGKAEWVKPYTDATVEQLARNGVQRLDVVCPSFSADCLETLEEIADENSRRFVAAGGKELRLIPSLNDQPLHIAMMAEIAAVFAT